MERKLEREREREREGSDVTLAALKLAMNFAPFLAKNLHISLAKSFALFLAKICTSVSAFLKGAESTLSVVKKRCALRNSSRSSFCFFQMA